MKLCQTQKSMTCNVADSRYEHQNGVGQLCTDWYKSSPILAVYYLGPISQRDLSQDLDLHLRLWAYI